MILDKLFIGYFWHISRIEKKATSARRVVEAEKMRKRRRTEASSHKCEITKM